MIVYKFFNDDLTNIENYKDYPFNNKINDIILDNLN